MKRLSLKAKQDHLEKEAKTRDPLKGIAEFVWNALDADATEVRVDLRRNALGGLEEIIIRDNGSGITIEKAHTDFESLGDSWKRKLHKTPMHKRALHGKLGRGRLKFFSLAEQARWTSIYKDQDSSENKEFYIQIRACDLENCDVSEPDYTNKVETGTTVELSPLKETFDWLISQKARLEFTVLFAPYILQYPNVKIFYDGRAIDPSETIAINYEFKRQIIHAPTRSIDDVYLRVIEWNTQVDGRKIHLGGDKGIVLGALSANVIAPGFEFSVYAYSKFFEEIANANLLEVEGLTDPNFSHVMEVLRDKIGSYFRKRMAERSRGIIDDLKIEGAYPYEGDPKDEVERRERQVFDIATFAVSSYSRDFKKAETSMKRMALTLMKEALRHNPESLTTIIRAVAKLPKPRQDEFSALLEKTELGNIISASSLIAERITVLEVLKNLVFSPEHRKTVKERGQLDVLVRDNTWLFGELFHLTLPEAGLTKVLNRVAEDIGTSCRVRKVRKPNGKVGRVDCLLGRRVLNADIIKREYLIIELKRPSLTIGRKELDQIEDYARTLRNQADFAHTDTSWHFFLVTGEYDDAVKARINQLNRPVGLADDSPNSKVWVKSWAEIIRDCEGRMHFIQDKLRVEISDSEIEDRIASLKKSMTREPETEFDKEDEMTI